MIIRRNGILLPLSSLPSPYAIGDLGPPALDFVNFLHRSKQTLWQLLPLNSISPFQHFSPYSSNSSLACSTHYLSPELLLQNGMLERQDLVSLTPPSNFREAFFFKTDLAKKALDRLSKPFDSLFEAYCHKNSYWLEDHALFCILNNHFKGVSWNTWPGPLRDREPSALSEVGHHFTNQIKLEQFLQFILDYQISELRQACHNKGIQIIGDIPFYVNFHSADVWAHRNLFRLNRDLAPAFLSGVPPDRFSATGQLWGNPVYNWKQMARDQFRWWIGRFERMFAFYDMVRIDHFRGFVSYWQVPAGARTARDGEWVDTPANSFFSTMLRHFPCFPVIAEDLGTIDAKVREVMNCFGFPGTKVLLFAFDTADPANPYLPHNYPSNCLAATGTHDTSTTRGWFEKEADENVKLNLFRYLGREVTSDRIHWELMRLVMMSRANLAVFPMQDILGLGDEARINTPGTAQGNWLWRMPSDYFDPALESELAQMTTIFNR